MYIQLKQQAHDPTQENSKSTSKIQVYSDSKIPSRQSYPHLFTQTNATWLLLEWRQPKRITFLSTKSTNTSPCRLVATHYNPICPTIHSDHCLVINTQTAYNTEQIAITKIRTYHTGFERGVIIWRYPAGKNTAMARHG